MAKIPAEGTLEKDGNGWVVRVPGKPHLAKVSGVICENPRAAEPSRIYAKHFLKKRIYAHDQYDQAVAEVLRSGNDVVVLGMNGYSVLSEQQCHAWGVRPGAYEAACDGLLVAAYETLNNFKGIDIRFADGASMFGVDKVIIQVARRLNRPHLGHSCPEFMMYVEDDEDPVIVSRNQLEYADRFTTSLDVLIAANGRKQAFEMDIDAVFKKRKYVIPINVLRAISNNGGPPMFSTDDKIEDAIAVFLNLMRTPHNSLYEARDKYRGMVHFVCSELVDIVRPMISPERAFSNILPQFHGQVVP